MAFHDHLRTYFLMTVAAGALSACALDQPVTGQTSAAHSEQVDASANETSEVAALIQDGKLRTGVLENGMRYAIYPSDTPSDAGALWLRFDVGSFHETDAQAGLAHFLEHMAFNGSKNVPEGEMVKILERLGLAFGADTNAFTSFDQTVYTLDLPNLEDETLDTALFIMRETAENLTVTEGAVDRERGIILSEERSRDTPGFRSSVAQMEFFYPETLLPKRLPIGDMEVVRGEGAAAQMRTLYQDYYRPENTFLVFVGDEDPAIIEARVKDTFGDWGKGTRPVGAEPDLGVIEPRPTEAGYYFDPGARTSLTISSVSPASNRPDTAENRYQDLLVLLGDQILNRRLTRLSEKEDSAIFGSRVGSGEQYELINSSTITLSMTPDKWEDALTIGEQELRRMIEFGVTQSELDEMVSNFAVAYESAAKSADTRNSTRLARAIVSGYGASLVFTHPSDDLTWFESVRGALSVDAVNAAFKKQWKISEPLVFLVSSEEIANAETKIADAFAASQTFAVSAPVEVEAVEFAYTDFGAPGSIVERSDIEDLGISQVNFDNGVKLNVKQTDFEDNLVRVTVGFGAGQLEMPKGLPGLSTLMTSTYTSGGLGAHSADELRSVLAGKSLNSEFSINEDAFRLSGATQPQDLDLQMQVLAAYLTDPGLRPEALANIRQVAETFYDGLEATPNGVMQKERGKILYSGDLRFVFPTEAQFRERSFEEVRAVTKRARHEGAIEIGIVGDVAIDEAIAAVASTFGALPQRESVLPPFEAARSVSFPAGNATPIELTHKGEPDRAQINVAWPTTDDRDIETYRKIVMLERVLSNRLLERVREADGATYSPSASSSFSRVFPGYGYLNVSLDLLPADTERYFDIVDEIAEGLTSKAVTKDELNRVLEPLLQSIDENDESNPAWLSLLSRAQSDPTVIERHRTRREDYRAITPEDILETAQRYLVAEKANRIRISPTKAAENGVGRPGNFSGEVSQQILEVKIDGVVHPFLKWQLEDIDPDVFELQLLDDEVHEVCFFDGASEFCADVSTKTEAWFRLSFEGKPYNIVIRPIRASN